MLTQECLKQLLSYNPETGEWRWVNAPKHNARLNNLVAGSVRHDGYRKIRVGGTAYYASRLAFLYMTGKWPKNEVDHIDRDPSNDCWSNLREATSSQNKYNRDTRYSGYRGVYPCGKDTWRVQVGGIYLGTFGKLEEAIAARDATAVDFAGDFAVLNGAI